MADRSSSGSGSRELTELANELEQFRVDLADGRYAPAPESVSFARELAEIQAHLYRIGERLEFASPQAEPAAERHETRQGVGPGEVAHPPA